MLQRFRRRERAIVIKAIETFQQRVAKVAACFRKQEEAGTQSVSVIRRDHLRQFFALFTDHKVARQGGHRTLPVTSHP